MPQKNRYIRLNDTIMAIQEWETRQNFPPDFFKWDLAQNKKTLEGILDTTLQVPILDGTELLVPETWWQHFKEYYFGDWLKKKFPIRYITYQPLAFFTNYKDIEAQQLRFLKQKEK